MTHINDDFSVTANAATSQGGEYVMVPRSSVKLAIGHIRHLADFLSKAQAQGRVQGYSFEALGEDMGTLEYMLSARPAVVAEGATNNGATPLTPDQVKEAIGQYASPISGAGEARNA